ncbi:MAG: PHP domain-containing protein, partial [Nitrosomonas sp.]|nr:PHP domain-containing protein [Nitrosomonas sp.]
MLNIDLHCHSNISDGVLPPAQLVERAAMRGVEILALTDHDDISGLAEARQMAEAKSITFI